VPWLVVRHEVHDPQDLMCAALAGSVVVEVGKCRPDDPSGWEVHRDQHGLVARDDLPLDGPRLGYQTSRSEGREQVIHDLSVHDVIVCVGHLRDTNRRL